MTLLDEAAWRGKIYSGGWTSGAAGDVAVTEPATGEEIARIGCAGPSDVAAAAARAAAAQPAWAATPHTERAAIHAFTDTRWVTIRGDIAPYPF